MEGRQQGHSHTQPVAAGGSAPPLALSARAQRTPEPPISFLIAEALKNPSLVNFAAGLVDQQTLPVEPCLRITGRLFSDPVRGRSALQYGTTQGDVALRRAALSHLETLEGKPASQMRLDVDDLVITTGSQQALYLIAECLLDVDDIVITANPSYFVFAGALASFGARVLAVPMGDEGMDVEAVGRLLQRLEDQGQLARVKFIYCTSYFQNPTGLSLAAGRRRRLLELVRDCSRAQRILIIEDAAYRELRYDGPAMPSIKSFDADNLYTVLCQTFSKPFAPGLKLGYSAMPRELRDAVLHQKGNHDFGSSSLCQQIALEALADGSYAQHGQTLREGYRAKRDLMLDALERHMPQAPGLSWTRPHGGLYVWVTLPEGLDASRGGALFERCVQGGVLYVPGEYCYLPDEHGNVPRHHLRLSFGAVAPEQIEPGIRRLAGVVHELLPTMPARRCADGGVRVSCTQ